MNAWRAKRNHDLESGERHRRKHTSKGKRVFKFIAVRIFHAGNQKSKLLRFLADPGTAYSEDQVDKYLDAIAEDLEEKLPSHEYELVQIGEGIFNFVWRGERKAPASQEPASA